MEAAAGCTGLKRTEAWPAGIKPKTALFPPYHKQGCWLCTLLTLEKKKISSLLPISLVNLYAHTHTHTPDFLLSNEESIKTVGKVLELSSMWLSTKRKEEKEEALAPFKQTWAFSSWQTTAFWTNHTAVLLELCAFWERQSLSAEMFKGIPGGMSTCLLQKGSCHLPESDQSSAEPRLVLGGKIWLWYLCPIL